MAKRRVIRRTNAPVASTKVVRKQVEEEDLEDLENEELDDVDDDDDDEEVTPRRVSRRVVEDDIADEEDEDEDEDEDEEPVKISKKAAVTKRPAAPAPAPAKAAPVVIKKVDEVVADNVFAQLLTALEEGVAIVITRIGDNKWQVAKGNAVKLGTKKMSGADAWRETASPEYLAWSASWKSKTYDQKLAYAKKKGVKWDEHEDKRINEMRLTAAVRASEGIEKYKPEYRDRASRAALRG